MATRQYVLERLAAERRAAEDAFEHGRVAELDAQIAELSAATSPQDPSRETTSAPCRTPKKRSAHVVRS